MTNARSVSQKLGYLLALSMLLVIPAKGELVTITVTGTINGAVDDLHIFGAAKTIPKGTPYTIVFTFSDAKGQPMNPGCSGSGIAGRGPASPGTATLTINGISYEFGARPGMVSKAWRTTASGCSESAIGVSIAEGLFPYFSNINFQVSPPPGTRSLTQIADWRGALSVSSVYARNTYNSFTITRQGNQMQQTMSYLSVDTVTIGKR